MKQRTGLFSYAVTYNVATDGGAVGIINLGLTLNRNCVIIPGASFALILTTFTGAGGPPAQTLDLGFVDGGTPLMNNIPIASMVAGASIPLDAGLPFQPAANQTQLGAEVADPLGGGFTAGKLLLILNVQNISAALTYS